MSFNKSAILGKFVTAFIATIIVVIILFIFILGSGLIKKVSNIHDDVKIADEKQTGILDFYSYMDNFGIYRKSLISYQLNSNIKTARAFYYSEVAKAKIVKPTSVYDSYMDSDLPGAGMVAG